MSRKILSFDLETLGRAPNEPGASYDLGISCIGAVLSDDERPRSWHPPYDLVDARYGQHMSVMQIEDFVRYLIFMCRTQGYIPLAMNGLGFDFRVLSASGISHPMFEDLVDLALDSIDPSFQFFCERGWMVGLEAFAQGMGVPGKRAGMDGMKAIEMWRDGDGDAQRMVLDYVVQDAHAALNVYQKMIETGDPRFMTKTTHRRKPWDCLWDVGDGALRKMSMTEVLEYENRRLLTCRQALLLPEPPPPSWLPDPWDRVKFAGWTGMVW